MPSVRMGIGIDPHANHLCRLFGFSESIPLVSFGSWYISVSLLDSYIYRIWKLAALVNLQLWKEKKLQICKSPIVLLWQILLLILGKSNISYYNYSVPFSLYWHLLPLVMVFIPLFFSSVRNYIHADTTGLLFLVTWIAVLAAFSSDRMVLFENR